MTRRIGSGILARTSISEVQKDMTLAVERTPQDMSHCSRGVKGAEAISAMSRVAGELTSTSNSHANSCRREDQMRCRVQMSTAKSFFCEQKAVICTCLKISTVTLANGRSKL